MIHLISHIYTTSITNNNHSDSEDESAEEGSDIEEEVEDLGDGSDDDDDDDDDPKAAARPYMTLIKSLTEENDAPHAKRRKLDHQTTANENQDQQLKDEQADPDKDVADDVDFVEEPEEAPEEADEQGAFDDEDDEDEKVDSSDSFESHFVAIDEASVARRLEAIEEMKWAIKKVASKGIKVVLNGPDTGNDSDQIVIPSPVTDASELSLKHRLKESMAGKKSKLDAVEQSLAPYIFGYQDLFFCNRNLSNGKSVRRLACLHALNHVFK